MKKYTIEEIYSLVGKYDYTSSIELRYNSDAYMRYGSSLVAVIVYTQKEREELERRIKCGEKGREGMVKMKYLLYDLSDDKKKALLEEGVSTNDIVDLSWYVNNLHQNLFQSQSERKINTHFVKYNLLPGGRDIYWMYGFLKKCKTHGIALCPEDEMLYLAYKLIIEPKEITKDEKTKIYVSEEMMNPQIALKYLEYKFFSNTISEGEIKELVKLKYDDYTERLKILNNHLQDLGSSINKLKETNPEIESELEKLVRRFHQRRFNSSGRFPLYLDLNGFLHIYLRHVKELQFAKQFKNKDKFQLRLEDVESVMRCVLGEINNDYQLYKEKNPDKRYRKYGDESFYFLGDYYTIHVSEDGCIETFYRNRKCIS